MDISVIIGGFFFFFSSRRRHTRFDCDWSSDVCSSDLAGIETREQALGLKGSAVSVRRGSLPEPGEGHYYLADLVGLEVVNERGEALGVVKRLFTNGAQDVMELAGERTRLLPWVAAVVKSVDLPNRRIEVAWEADW